MAPRDAPRLKASVTGVRWQGVRKKIKIKKGEDDVIHARLAIHRGGGGAAEASGGAGGREARAACPG